MEPRESERIQVRLQPGTCLILSDFGLKDCTHAYLRLTAQQHIFLQPSDPPQHWHIMSHHAAATSIRMAATVGAGQE